MDDWILLIDESRDAGLQRLITDAALSAGVREVIARTPKTLDRKNPNHLSPSFRPRSGDGRRLRVRPMSCGLIPRRFIFRAGQSRVLEMIAADAPLADALSNLVLLMESQAEGLRCSILLLNRDGKHVRHCTAPSLPEVFQRAMEGSEIGPRNGSCGTAMYTRRPVVAADVMTNSLWADYRELARVCELSACWSTPILSAQGDVLGFICDVSPGET